MSYTPTDWKTGDVITAEKLNNIEQGIVNARAEVSFVKIIDNYSVPTGAINFDKGLISMGGSLAEEKSLGELVNGKTIIGYTSSFRYNNLTYCPCVTAIPNFSLDSQVEYMNLKIVGFDVIINGISQSQDTSSSGTLNIYAICI